MRTSVLAAGAALSVLAMAGGAQAQEQPLFTQMVVFGDSLSDVGNVATLQNRPDLNSFTTNPGPVAVEVVAQNYGFTLAPTLQGGTNVAYGGAGFVNNAFGTGTGSPTLTAQVNAYLAANPTVDPNALFTLFGGGNDVNFAATNLVLGTLTLAQAQANMTAAGNQALSLINALQAAGAKTIIVVNTPDVGLTPSARGANAISPGSSARITGLSQTLNATLHAGLEGKRGIVPVNAFLFLQEAVNNADAFGIVNVTEAACTTGSSLACTTSTLKAPDADQTWLFADGIHPTTAGHQALGDLILSELAAPQQISLLAEQPLSVVATARGAIRTELMDPAAGGRAFTHILYGQSDFEAQHDIRASEAQAALVTIGGFWPLGERAGVGAAFTAAKSEMDFGIADGGFDGTAVLGSVFGRMQVGEGGYLTADANVGRLSFDDVERRLVLGNNLRSERGETDGRTKGVGVGGGWWFGEGTLQHGPVASFTYQEVRVDEYAETGSNSSTMRFGKQLRESAVTELGWAFRGSMEAASYTLSPYARLTYNIESEDEARLVDAGLVTMPGTFTMPGFTPNDEWFALQVGTGIDVGDSVAVRVGYLGRFGDAQDDHSLMVGLKFEF